MAYERHPLYFSTCRHYDALCGDLKLEERRRQDSYPWFRDIYMLQGMEVSRQQ